jgi:lipid-binding SYLF domain-containing protein
MAESIRGKVLPALVALLLVLGAPSLYADSRETIDAGVSQALQRLRAHSPEAGELVDRAVAVLVFPDVVKLGFGVGGEYGEGALRIGGETQAYYVIAGVSFGLEAGAEYKSEVILFMTEEALRKFRNSSGWQVGVDGAVVLAKAGAEGAIDTLNSREPVLGFIFSNRGLIFNLSLDGAKITRIAR